MRLGARVIQNLSESSYTIVNKGFEETVGVDKYHKRGSYVLPLSEAQPLLVKIAGSLVFYDLHTYQPDEKIVNDQKLALAMLRDIANGTVALTVAGLEPQNTAGSGARITDRDRQMTQDNMTGFI